MTEYVQDVGGSGYESGEDDGSSELYLDQATGQLYDQQGQLVDAQQFGGQGGDHGQRGDQSAEIDDLRLDMEAGLLEQKYPELQDTEIADRVVTIAEQLADEQGRPELARDLHFIEDVYLRYAELGGAVGERIDRVIAQRAPMRAFFGS